MCETEYIHNFILSKLNKFLFCDTFFTNLPISGWLKYNNVKGYNLHRLIKTLIKSNNHCCNPSSCLPLYKLNITQITCSLFCLVHCLRDKQTKHPSFERLVSDLYPQFRHSFILFRNTDKATLEYRLKKKVNGHFYNDAPVSLSACHTI